MKFNPDFIKRLAMGDNTAFEEIKDLPRTERMAIGLAVDEMRYKENIIPANNGMSIYDKPKSMYVDDDAVAAAMQQRMDLDRENRERQEKLREKYIEEQTRQAIERSRAGLQRNDQLIR